MKIEISPSFFYRVEDENEKIFYQKFNTDKENVVRNDKNVKFHKGEWVYVKINDYTTHIVKPTENIEKISKLYNVSAEKIILDNGLDKTPLFIGKILKIYNKDN